MARCLTVVHWDLYCSSLCENESSNLNFIGSLFCLKKMLCVLLRNFNNINIHLNKIWTKKDICLFVATLFLVQMKVILRYFTDSVINIVCNADCVKLTWKPLKHCRTGKKKVCCHTR